MQGVLMKLVLKFKDIKLGTLLKKNKYIYEPDIIGLKLFEKKYPYQYKFFQLKNIDNTEFDEIPYQFNDFLQGVNRIDIIKKAGIENSDDSFVKLCKIAKLNLATDYNISVDN